MTLPLRPGGRAPPPVKRPRQPRLTAEMTALSEAVTMLASRPTPHSISSPTAHSTYAAAMRVATRGEGVLGVVEHPHVEARAVEAVDGVHERRDRAVAGAVQLADLAVDVDVDVELVLLPRRRGGVHGVQLQRRLAGEVLALEGLPDRGRASSRRPRRRVCSCTARLNSICSRRGRSSLCSDFIT